MTRQYVHDFLKIINIMCCFRNITALVRELDNTRPVTIVVAQDYSQEKAVNILLLFS